MKYESGRAAHSVPFLLSRHSPLRVLPTIIAHLWWIPQALRFLTLVRGSRHCFQTYARRRRLIQWSNSLARVRESPGAKYVAQPRRNSLSSPTIWDRLRPRFRAVSSRTRSRKRRRLFPWMPMRVWPMNRVMRKPRYLLCQGRLTSLFSLFNRPVQPFTGIETSGFFVSTGITPPGSLFR